MAKQKDKTIQVDGTGFNATYFQNHSLQDFIKDNLPGVSDSVGDEAAKKEWLTTAYNKVVPQKEAKEASTKDAAYEKQSNESSKKK